MTRNAAIRTYLPSLALFAVLAGATLASQGLIVRAFVHDLFFVSDSIWRSFRGEVPHVDFQTPIGQAFYWPYALVSQVSGGSITDILSANVAVAAFLLLLGFAVLPSRFSPLLLFLGLGSIVITALTGRSVDENLFVYDYLAPYNRWGWSFAILAAFIVAVPPREASSRWQPALGALCLGTAIAILYYMKLSYFVAVLGLAIGAALLRVLPLRTLLLAAVCFAAFALVVELLFGNNLLYLQELRRAAEVNMVEGRGLVRVLRLGVFMAVGAVFGGIAVLLLLLLAPGGQLKAWVGAWWRPIAVIALMIGAATLIRVQNHARWELGMLGGALIVAAEYGRRRGLEARAGAEAQMIPQPTRVWRRAVALAFLAGGSALLPALDAASIVAHAAETRLSSGCTAPALRGTPMEKLLFPRPGLLLDGATSDHAVCASILHSPPGLDYVLDSDEGNYRRLFRTAALLRQRARPGQDVVLALEFANPFPFILRAPPPKGALIWFDLGRSYSSTIHPDPSRLLAGTDFVVQADYPAAAPPNRTTEGFGKIRTMFNLWSPADNGLGPGQDAWMVYGTEVQAQFTPVARTEEITIWRRR